MGTPAQTILTAAMRNTLVTGDVFAVHTSAGNYAKAMVTGELDSKQNHGLIIQWVTYMSPPSR